MVTGFQHSYPFVIQHIYLTGFRGTGKTSVGSIISRERSLPLIDLDEKIETAAGKSIREIFDEGGEPMFRELESRSLADLVGRPRSVISLGGGTILRDSNRRLIRDSGICIWLDADAETLMDRIKSDATTGERRPSLTQLSPAEEIEQLLRDRRPLYQEVSTLRIDTAGKSIEQVAAEAIVRLPHD